MSILTPGMPDPGLVDRPDEARRDGLQRVVDRLVERQATGRISYWATYTDERGVGHYAFTTDPVYADRSPENAASRASSVAAFGRAIERNRATLAEFGHSD